MKRALVVSFLLASASFAATLSAAPVSSITQYGVTWTFDKEYESGQFASGDHWVVGPVVVVSVSPAPTGTRNGSAVNPMGGRQGYDDRGGQYATDDLVTFPYTLAVDESLVSSVSKPEGVETQNVGCLQSQAVLTAVAAPLPATALRPAYAGTYKQHLDAANIQWSLLPNLPPPGSAPSGTELLAMAERPRIDHLSSWTIQHSCAEDNWNNGAGAHACYGREYSTFVSEAAQYLMLDTPERDELAISMIQLGIDNYGVIKAGGNFAPNGGHHNARKWPVVFAATMLDDCDMLKVGEEFDDSTFGEDGHTYFGTNGTALFGWDCGGGHGTYFEDGCSGGGAKDCRDPAGLVDGCEDYRNCCTSGYWVGQALATHMMHATAVWNHEPYFAYVDRWMNGDVDGGGSASSAFVEEMWSLYRDTLPPGAAVDTLCGGGGSSGAGGSAGTSSGGASGSGTGGSGGASGSGTGGSGGTNAAESDDDGGCGCRTAGSTRSLGAWLWLSALVLVVGRRARRHIVSTRPSA
jgi:MYXO-CTERM domain-containing protein